MAIFGTLEEMPAAEVFSAVRRLTGTLNVRGARLGSIEVHLHAGLVVGFARDGEPAIDALGLRGAVLGLLALREGDFEFRRRSLEHMGEAACLSVPLTQLVVNALGDAAAGEACRDALPSPKTVFAWLEAPRVWLDDDLQRFCENAEPLLRAGGSNIGELAATAGISVGEACLQIYRLRLAGVTSAIREREVTKLRPGRASPPARSAPEPGADADLRHVRIQRPASTFLSRLLAGLANLVRP